MSDYVFRHAARQRELHRVHVEAKRCSMIHGGIAAMAGAAAGFAVALMTLGGCY